MQKYHKSIKVLLIFIIFAGISILGVELLNLYIQNQSDVQENNEESKRIPTELSGTPLQVDQLRLVAENDPPALEFLSSNFAPNLEKNIYYSIDSGIDLEIYSLDKDNKNTLVRTFDLGSPNDATFLDPKSLIYKISDEFDQYLYFERIGSAPILIYKTDTDEVIRSFAVERNTNLVYLLLSDRQGRNRIIAINPNGNIKLPIFEAANNSNIGEITAVTNDFLYLRTGSECVTLGLVTKQLSKIDCNFLVENSVKKNLVINQDTIILYDVEKKEEDVLINLNNKNSEITSATLSGNTLLFVQKTSSKNSTDMTLVKYDIANERFLERYEEINLIGLSELIYFDDNIYANFGSGLNRLEKDDEEFVWNSVLDSGVSFNSNIIILNENITSEKN